MNESYENQDWKGRHDYREPLVRDDIDALVIAVSDCWRAPIHDMWSGPSTMMDCVPCQVRRNWRWNDNTGDEEASKHLERNYCQPWQFS